MRYAQIINGVIQNIILWDGLSPYGGGGNLVSLKDDSIDIGWKYDGKTFTPATYRSTTGALTVEADKQKLIADGRDGVLIRVINAEFPNEYPFSVALDGRHYSTGRLTAGFDWQILLKSNTVGQFVITITNENTKETAVLVIGASYE